ncbi:YbjN domain-containing protein [Janthinobacterium fluminis]|uniref:YbjN domain-containing protein n=1 Tax=Janthinobacterium fluminis TaxID=2987524 RepID=A0ABT5JZG7_9BURK|nr:YbjN domain-containing protein [Janthinobacterium fluminis]MDC8757979.1 YbjN domain-containing protein [Janthinobacterium fluminis]
MEHTTHSTAAAPADLLTTLNADQVSDAIKAAGCAVTRIEQDGVVHLHSASHGVGFQVLWGNVAVPGQYADLTLSCPLRVQGGELPDGILAEWHRSKRFARVAQHGDFLVLEMDVLAAGGVSPAYLDISLQLWTQMMGQFFLHLRNFSAAAPAPAAAAETAEALAEAV